MRYIILGQEAKWKTSRKKTGWKEIEQAMRTATLSRGMIAGSAGGLAGLVLMYLFGAGIFTLLGWPANTSFLIIGDAAAAFFSGLGIGLAGGVPLGLLLYCLIGLILGAVLGVAEVRLETLRPDSLRKGMTLSIAFVEVMSLPLLAAGALALKMSAADTALWCGISFVMHLVYGLALGLVTSHGLGRVVHVSPA
jgi:hypothetical protein